MRRIHVGILAVVILLLMSIATAFAVNFVCYDHQNAEWVGKVGQGSSYVTAGTCDNTGNLWLLGHDNGCIRIFDTYEFDYNNWNWYRGTYFQAHAGRIYQLLMSQKYMASCAEDRIIKLWDADIPVFDNWNTPLKLVRQIYPDREVYCLAFSSDGKLLVSGSKDGFVQCWETSSGKKISQTYVGGIVCSVQFFKDDRTIIAGLRNRDGDIVVVDIIRGEKIAAHPAHAYGITAMRTLPWFSEIVTSGNDGLLNVWNYDFQLLKTVHLYSPPMTAMDISPDQKMILTGTSDGMFRIYDTAGKLLPIDSSNGSHNFVDCIYGQPITAIFGQTTNIGWYFTVARRDYGQLPIFAY